LPESPQAKKNICTKKTNPAAKEVRFMFWYPLILKGRRRCKRLRKLLNPDSEAQPRFYDLLSEVKDWPSSTLVLHGEQDSLIPVSQALLLRDRLVSLGKPHRLVLFPEHGHRLPVREIKDQVLQFLKDNGGSACALSDR
jgi:acetyl esterase/lipase